MSSEDYYKYLDWKLPAPIEGWVVSSDLRKEVGWTKLEFPAPLEVWVVSYELISKWGSQDKEEFPSPLEVWVVSYLLV